MCITRHPKPKHTLPVIFLSVLSAGLWLDTAGAEYVPRPVLAANLEANVSVDVAPEENGKLVYAHIAEPTVEASDGAKLAPILIVGNNGNAPVTLNTVTVEFLGPPFAVPVTFDVNVEIAPGGEQSINLQNHPDYVDDEGDYSTYNIKLPYPPPPAVNFVLNFEGITLPTEVFRQLAKHDVGYRFPGAKSDLGPGKFWSGKSDWVSGKHSGNERFAYDIGVRTWDGAAWTEVEPGTSKCVNENWLIWDTPVRAIADGVVLSVTDGNADRDPTRGSCEGTPSQGLNWIKVQHGDEYARYLHLKQGTAVVAVGDTVEAGDELARAGNSGTSSNPHLHIDVRRDDQLRPLHFRCTMAIDRKTTDLDGVGAASWVELDKQALAWNDSLIWPSPDAGYAEVARHGITAAAYQNTFTNITACSYMPFWVDGYDVNGKTYFNALFRPADAAWQARHGLSSAQYQAAFDEWTDKGYRPLQVESYLQDNRIRYAVIFVKKSGPAWVAYHGKNATEHQTEFDQLKRKGFHPVNISVVSIDGNRRYTALYEKSDVGSWQAKSFLTPAEYQQAFDDNKAAGRQLAYVQAYNHNGAVRFSGIWYSMFKTAFAARHGMSSDEYQKEWEEFTGKKGHRTQAVTGYEQDNQASFAALWRKPD
jgi:murein DD-endopeptidase MepM/ murein hydrolase activator NlpD